MASSSPHQTQAIPCLTHQLKIRAGKKILSKKSLASHNECFQGQDVALFPM